MWISEKLAVSDKKATPKTANTATVTASQNGFFEASCEYGIRSADFYFPYGIRSVAPTGFKVLFFNSQDEKCICGCKSDCSDIESGEVEIFSQGGAKIELKNDGSVIINGLVINSEGVIEDGE